jgi:hypothetical protein
MSNMMEDLLKIKDRPLGEMLDNFYICESCSIVDNDSGRLERGHKCTHCSKIDDRGMSYFTTRVTSLINLMQEFYHTQQIILDDQGQPHTPSWAGNIKLPVIIFFSTLRELLLNNLIEELFKAKQVEAEICERLLFDNQTHRQRLDKLFRTLTGEKWKNALKLIDKNEGTDFISLNEFIETVVKARNEFVHEGGSWEINEDMADNCMKNIYPMLQLHALLHNYFVFTIYDFNSED